MTAAAGPPEAKPHEATAPDQDATPARETPGDDKADDASLSDPDLAAKLGEVFAKPVIPAPPPAPAASQPVTPSSAETGELASAAGFAPAPTVARDSGDDDAPVRPDNARKPDHLAKPDNSESRIDADPFGAFGLIADADADAEPEVSDTPVEAPPADTPAHDTIPATLAEAGILTSSETGNAAAPVVEAVEAAAGFAGPGTLAPDPTPHKSHLDTTSDTPFSTDFQAGRAAAGSRHSRQIHAERQRRRALLTAGWFTFAMTVGGLAGFVWFARETMVRLLPGTAKLYAAVGQPVNARGLAFENVAYDWREEAGQTVMAVGGDIHNVSKRTLRVPTLVFVLMDDSGQELFQWATKPNLGPIAAGARTRFAAKIPAPPAAATRLRVRFARDVR